MKLLFKLKFIIILAALIIILNLLFLSSAVAEFFSTTVSRFFNIVLTSIFGVVGFSVAEWVFLFLIVFVIVKIVLLIINLIRARFLKVKKSLYRLVLLALIIVLVINLTITSGYSRPSLDKPLNLTLEQLDEQKLKAAAVYYGAELTNANQNIERDENGDVKSPYSFNELNKLLNSEFDKLNNKYFTNHDFTAKKIVFSNALCAFSISGMYFPLTCEPNVSTTCMSYELPIIMAHELSHAHGVMRENEANFLAYYICINSDDQYLKYCGLMYAAIIMINNYNNFNHDDATALYDALPKAIRTEYDNASKFYDKHQNNFLSSVADFFNNLWLQSNKVTNGTNSYSDTAVRLYALYKLSNV